MAEKTIAEMYSENPVTNPGLDALLPLTVDPGGTPTDGGTTRKDLLKGVPILLHSDETDSSEHASSASESSALKSYSLAANSFAQILIEVIVRSRVEQDANTRCDFTWRLKEDSTARKTFIQRIIASSTTGLDSGDRDTTQLSTIITGGQTGSVTLAVTCQPSASNANNAALVHAFRVWGIP